MIVLGCLLDYSYCLLLLFDVLFLRLFHVFFAIYFQAVKPAKQGKKARQRLDDLVDLGEGYDETDPFIDNSEAVSIQ